MSLFPDLCVCVLASCSLFTDCHVPNRTPPTRMTARSGRRRCCRTSSASWTRSTPPLSHRSASHQGTSQVLHGPLGPRGKYTHGTDGALELDAFPSSSFSLPPPPPFVPPSLSSFPPTEKGDNSVWRQRMSVYLQWTLCSANTISLQLENNQELGATRRLLAAGAVEGAPPRCGPENVQRRRLHATTTVARQRYSAAAAVRVDAQPRREASRARAPSAPEALRAAADLDRIPPHGFLAVARRREGRGVAGELCHAAGARVDGGRAVLAGGRSHLLPRACVVPCGCVALSIL